MSRKNTATSILERASLQLKGQRPTKPNSEEDEMQDYFSALSKKTGDSSKKSKEVDWGAMLDSSNSFDDENNNQKKAETKVSNSSKFLKKKKQDNETKENLSPKGRKSPPKVKSNKYAGKSSALDKAEQFTSKYKPKQHAPKFSDSDMSMSISIDSDLAAEMGVSDTNKLRQFKSDKSNSKPKRKPDSPKFEKESPPRSEGIPNKSQSTVMKIMKKSANIRPLSDEDSSSIVLGKGSGKFLKKKRPPSPKEVKPVTEIKKVDKIVLSPSTQKKLRFDLSETSDISSERPPKQPLGKGASPRKSTLKSAKASNSLTDDDMGLYSSFETPRTPKAESVLTSKGAHGQIMMIDDEMLESSTNIVREDSIADSISSGDSFRDEVVDENVMDMGSLEFAAAVPESPPPKRSSSYEKKKTSKTDIATKKDTAKKSDKKKKKSDSSKKVKETQNESNDLYQSFGLQTVDDLLSGHKSYDDDSISDVPYTRGSNYEKKPAPDFFNRVGVQSMEELTYSEPVASKYDETSEIVTENERDDYKYESDFEIVTESKKSSLPVTAESYTAEFDDETSVSEIASAEEGEESTDTSSTVITGKSRSRDSETFTESESDTISYDDSITDSESYYKEKVKRRPAKTIACQTGEVPFSYTWDVGGVGRSVHGPAYGMQYVDPTPIATHVVPPEQIEAMSGFSPAVLALNDMLRQQLQLTRTFVDSQRRMYQMVKETAQETHQYTTLQDTKEYIRQHKKPVITFKEALKQVKREMKIHQ